MTVAGLSLIGVLFLPGSFSLRDIVNSQAGWHWNICIADRSWHFLLI